MMERNEITEKIKKILSTVLKHEKFEMKDELTAAEVEGWDSLSHITIISEVEEAFKIKFKLKELNKLKNIGSLIEIVQSKL
jgi:acyl carrier protein